MSAITRSWIALGAAGAGLIHLALAVDAPLLGTVLLAGIGITEFAWGVLVVFDERFLAPRVAVIAALAPVMLWVVAIVVGIQSFRPVPLGVATVMELFVALTIAVSLRRRREAKPVSTRRYVIGLAVGALIIGGITVPALGATAAGQQVVNPDLFDGGGHH